MVTRAVVPAAGRGTRLLPATRSIPKELLPLGSTPVLDLVCAELAEAGIEELVMVVAPDKPALSRHARTLPLPVTLVEQRRPHGLGDAVLRAAGALRGEPFLVALPDALLDAAATRALRERVAAGDCDGAIAVERIPLDRVGEYGIAAQRDGWITALVEKPAPEEAPGNLAVAGRYVLDPAVFAVLERLPAGRGGEVQLTDALAVLLARGARIAALPLPAGTRRRDVGSREGYAAAFVEEVARASGLG